MTATADLPNKEIADFTEKLSFVSWDMWFILDSEDSFILKKINKTLMVGAPWATGTPGTDGTPWADGTDGTNGASFIFRWAYSWATDYVVNDTVTYDGSSYINILASTGDLPTNATYWELLAAKGTDWAGTWDMLKADNLSELANNATARTNIWLGNVDNTADTAKPVSTAQQTALNLKANIASPTFTGTVAGITKAMVWLSSVDDTSDATKNAATVTLTNKTLDVSNILVWYTQNTQTGTTYTLAAADAGKLLTLDNAAAIAVTIPTNAAVSIPVGSKFDIMQFGAGKVTFSWAGTTINSKWGLKSIWAQWVGVTLIKTATDTRVIAWDLIA